jgi:hypothetical protein
LTRADYEQARRTGRDPAEIREAKALIREAWEKSDNGASFENALHNAGLTLAQGDTARAPFVVVDEHGKVYGVARVVGEKTRQQAAGTQQRTAQQVQDAAAQIRQPLTPAEREAKAREFDRAAKEATRARDAYRDTAANATGAEKRAAMRAEYRTDFAAREAAKQAALLRETEQQKEERQAKEREEREAERRRRERQRER